MHSVMAGSWFFGRLPWKKYLLSSLPSPPLATALQRARMLRESSKTAGLSLCLPLLAQLPHRAWLRERALLFGVPSAVRIGKSLSSTKREEYTC